MRVVRCVNSTTSLISGNLFCAAPQRDMLLLGALGADASSPLQPRDSDVDSVPRKDSPQRQLRVPGLCDRRPNKAGTTSLDEHFIHRHGAEVVP